MNIKKPRRCDVGNPTPGLKCAYKYGESCLNNFSFSNQVHITRKEISTPLYYLQWSTEKEQKDKQRSINHYTDN
jgi:hypothetical protein